jgi:PAS domain S-box-containing protein
MVVSPPSNNEQGTARILIVEDEGIIAGHIASRLLKTGYSVAGIAESSDEAIATVREVSPDLILMDIRIKGSLDGIQTAAKVREDSDIPIIYLTAHTDQSTVDRAKMTEAFGFLTKPVHQTSLATSIEMAIHKHRADRAARTQRAFMETVLGAMADAMVVIDANRRIQYMNGPAEVLTGWKNDEARDREITRVLPLRELATELDASHLLFPPDAPQAPARVPRGLVASKRSGQRFPVEGEFAPCVSNGRVVGAVLTFRDATVRQNEENEIRHQYKMQAVGRLAAGIAHDFSNLLRTILRYTGEILGRSQGFSHTEIHALDEIRKAGDQAAGLTQQLLKFSCQEPVLKLDISLNDVIRDTEEIIRRLGGPLVRWHFLFEENLKPVRADRDQLRQVVVNLAANARDAMPGGGRITVETANVDAPQGASPAVIWKAFVALSVTDTGEGMSPDMAEHLFEPFFTTRQPGSGTGLGLSIVHSIVTDLGGTIHVDSEKGRGAAFTVYLPASEPGVRSAEAGETVECPVEAR